MKIGFAFGEHIRTEKVQKRRSSGSDSSLRSRSFLFPILIVVAGVLLLSKLFHLQIINGAEYSALSDSNRIRTEIIRAPRGVIFDRNGVPLVQNEPGFRRISKCNTKNKIILKNLPNGECSEIISREVALMLLAKGEKIEVATQRAYPYKDAMSHVLGYIGQISKDEIESEEFKEYNGLDWVGKSGIEREYEHILKGVDGAELSEVDAMGVRKRALGATDPISGKDITLTIDAKIQNAAYEASRDMKRGVVIVSIPDGQILALVSRPSYDPNLFTRDVTYKVASDSAYKNIDEVLTDSAGQPVLNRAIGGVYPPGSTFKIVTAAAGLDDGLIDEKYSVKDTGVIRVGEFSYANWYYTNYGRTDAGNVNVVRGLSRSNDIFFYKLAEKVGVDKLSIIARKMGLGEKTGIDLRGEVSGLVPNPEWKKEQIGESWYLGDTYHYGIGQGFLLTTPIQVNAFTEIIANGGTLYQPRLIKDQKSNLPAGKAGIKDPNLLSDETANLIRQGMIDSCKPKIGVAWPLFEFKVPASAMASARQEKFKIDGKNFIDAPASGSAEMVEIPIACKTGTAQHGGEETLPHAWITLFAPAYDPEIVVTVLNEESGEGSNEAAPIAKKILEAYFTR